VLWSILLSTVAGVLAGNVFLHFVKDIVRAQYPTGESRRRGDLGF
jgi:hypothetical protein